MTPRAEIRVDGAGRVFVRVYKGIYYLGQRRFVFMGSAQRYARRRVAALKREQSLAVLVSVEVVK